ncbi:MAG: hypothetical protein JWM91_714 [Rhodospirillales bacterium]|nr:hypothetical protein [Rhodospirillales bacterium]
MHRLVAEPDRTTLLYIGAENWPFPVPLVSVNGAWHFHVETGSMEVLFRRIGENELSAIEACHALVTAEKQYKAKSGDDFAGRYAQSMVGAHLAVSTGAAGGAFDTLLARAGSDRHPVPFRGHLFPILTHQRKHSRTERRAISSAANCPAASPLSPIPQNTARRRHDVYGRRR